MAQGRAGSGRASRGIRDALAGPVPCVLGVVGSLGLLLPWLLSPLASDERYHYVAAPYRLGGNLLNVVPWTINDLQWRMGVGRLDPVADGARQVVYFLGMEFAQSTGTPLFVVHGLVKIVLLGAILGSFWLLLRQLRRADGAPLEATARRAALLLLTAGTVLGVTTASPGRNGWTAYPLLCMGGVSLMFLVGAVALWVAHGWSRWTAARRTTSVIGLALIGALVVLSYELHWAAVTFAAVLVAFTGRTPWRSVRRQPGDAARWAALAGLVGGFLVALLWTRIVIASHVKAEYVGLQVDLGPAVVRTTALQVLNALPGTGIPSAIHGLTPAQATPMPFGGTGWLWGALLATGLVVVLRRIELPPGGGASRERGPLLTLGAALAVSALAAAVILSVSAQSHEIVKRPGDTYRGTPWIWVCLAGLLVMALLTSRRSEAVRRRAIVALPVAGALLAGAVVWPYSVAAVQTQRQAVDTQIWEAAQAELVNGSAEAIAVQHRCLLAQQATAWAGKSSYRRAYLPLYEEAFQFTWGRPWCKAGTVLPPPTNEIPEAP